MTTDLKKVIAFDIDGCWDQEPDIFKEFAYMLFSRNWVPIIVTGDVQPDEKLRRLGISHITITDDEFYHFPVIVAKGMSKDKAARLAGYKVDIWVDDMPETIRPERQLKETDDL